MRAAEQECRNHDHYYAGVEHMLVALLDEAKRRGVAHVDLEVRADNDSARRLYERHGFVDIAVRRNYYQPSGTDAIVMRLELTS